jgi:sugar lactone lactonase YvrE
VGVGVLAAVAAANAFSASTEWTITRVAGTGTRGFSGDGGPARSAQLNYPYGVAVDARGNLYIADSENARVRKVSPQGTITTFAGTGRVGFSGDGGPATEAQLVIPLSVAVDSSGDLYILDAAGTSGFRTRVRKVSPGGTITTFAGGGPCCVSLGDGGPATSADLDLAEAIALDGRGNMYITQENRVRKIDTGGTITTIAGGIESGLAGDGGPATSARFDVPSGIAADNRGNVYVVDTRNGRVRKIDVGGTITTFAGTTNAAASAGDGGPATAAALSAPYGITVDSEGDVFISEFTRVRKVTPSGTITTLAGGGPIGEDRDHVVATAAQLDFPAGLAVDDRGIVYVAEVYGARVRKIESTPAPAATQIVTLRAASPQRLLKQYGLTVTAGCIKACTLEVTGSVTVTGAEHAVTLSPAEAVLVRPGSTKLTLLLVGSTYRELRRVLTPGRRARAVISAKATDELGHVSSASRTVAVRG